MQGEFLGHVWDFKTMFHMYFSSTWPGMTLRLQVLVCEQPMPGWNGPTAPPTCTPQVTTPLVDARGVAWSCWGFNTLLQMCLATTWPGMTFRHPCFGLCKQPQLGWNGPTAPMTGTSSITTPLVACKWKLRVRVGALTHCCSCVWQLHLARC